MPPRQRPTENEYDSNQSDSLSRMATFTVEFRNVYGKLDDMNKNFDEVNRKLDAFANAFITRIEFEYLKARIVELEGTQKWIYRLIIGAIIMAGLGLILKTQGTIG